jgi:hypothetical protein
MHAAPPARRWTPVGLAVIVGSAAIICTSAALAEVIHDAMVIVLSEVAAVTVASITGLAPVLHHQQ